MHSNVHLVLRRRRRRINSLLKVIGLTAIAALLAAGCGADGTDDSDDGEKADDSAGSLVVYSGREEELVQPLYDQFEKETGIELDVRYGDSPALAAQLAEEGDKSPADVFFAQDAGAIGAVEDQLVELPESVLDEVDERFRDADGRWVGVSGRVRTLIFNTEMVEEGDLPESVFDLTDQKWKGKVGVAPTNSSFIGFVSAMRLVEGDERTREFLEGLVANDAQIYPKNGPIVAATASGEVEVGLVNHYYLYEQLAEDPEAMIDNHYFPGGDIGTMVNVSGIGIVASSDATAEAEQLVAFMLDEGQRFIVEEAEEREYPLAGGAVEGNEAYEEMPTLDEIETPEVDLTQLGDMLTETVEMIRESGLGE